MRHDLGVTSTPELPPPHWPEHLPVGALRVTRWSSRYDETVRFYHDIIGLPLLETFRASYGLDGTILGLPGSRVHLEIVGLRDGPPPTPGRDDLVFYCQTLPLGITWWRGSPPPESVRLRRSTTGRTTAGLRSRIRTAAKSYSSPGSTANEVIISATEHPRSRQQGDDPVLGPWTAAPVSDDSDGTGDSDRQQPEQPIM